MVIITFRTMANKADVAMVMDIAGIIMITDLTDVWNCHAHSALPVGQLQKEGAEKPALIYTYNCLLFLTPAHTDIIHQPCKCNTVFSCIYITAAISKFYASAYFSTSSIMVSACWKSGKNILPFVPSILALRFNSCPIVWTDSAVHPSLYVSLRQL